MLIELTNKSLRKKKKKRKKSIIGMTRNFVAWKIAMIWDNVNNAEVRNMWTNIIQEMFEHAIRANWNQCQTFPDFT